MTSPTPLRRPWVAAVLALLCSGLGHLYAGRPLAAVGFLALWACAATGMALAMRAGFAAFVASVLAVLAIWIGQAVLAARSVRRGASEPRPWFTRMPALVGFLVASVAASFPLTHALRLRLAHTVVARSRSMSPTILPGDYLVVAAGAPREMRGAVVVHAAPPGSPRPEPILKRIVATGGDTVEIRGGQLVLNGQAVPRQRLATACRAAAREEGGTWRSDPCVDFVETLGARTYHTYCTPGLPCGDVAPQRVPAGHVWVAGDFRDHSADSRVYGPVPEAGIIGEVRYVVLSVGEGGPRWDRVGHEPR